tara:strand:- start:562 stop:933 length:372 start_codon:yes stop_codon:yes gene_type:complete
MKNEDTKKNKLQKIRNDLFFIDKFVSTVNFKINRELAEIEIKVEKNNKLIEKYREIEFKNYKTQKTFNSNTNLAIEVFANNFSIIDQKIRLMETHTQQIYEKINLLATSITKLSTILEEEIEE